MWKLLSSIGVAALASAPAYAGVFSLSDLQWTLKNANGSIVIPGSVPSQAHLDLLRAGIITEPLLGINGALACLLVNPNQHLDGLYTTADFTQRWVLNDDWTYTADLSPFLNHANDASEKSRSDKTLLVFYGIDTIANIVSPGSIAAGSVVKTLTL